MDRKAGLWRNHILDVADNLPPNAAAQESLPSREPRVECFAAGPYDRVAQRQCAPGGPCARLRLELVAEPTAALSNSNSPASAEAGNLRLSLGNDACIAENQTPARARCAVPPPVPMDGISRRAGLHPTMPMVGRNAGWAIAGVVLAGVTAAAPIIAIVIALAHG